MNAVELLTPEGKPSGIFFCTACKYTAHYQDVAEQCCRPRLCQCGAECSNGWTICATCRHHGEEEKAAKRWEAAQKVPARDVASWVYDDDNDKFHRTIEDFLEWWEDEERPGVPRVYVATPFGLNFDAARWLEHLTEEHYEDAYEDLDAEAVAELQATLDWWEAEHGLVSYRPDYKQAVVWHPSPTPIDDLESPETSPEKT